MSTKKTIILDTVMNPSRRMLVANEDSFEVLSECCLYEIRGGSGAATCVNCENELAVPERGSYVPRVTFRAVLDNDWQQGWTNWLKYWFEIEEGELHFEGLATEDGEE